ncbi:MAG TPA: aldo/keto reductase [Streptosporangiaceae bacterium]|jgi:aryl-alcohol dehydrogenase-like predicted oxidoreductase
MSEEMTYRRLGDSGLPVSAVGIGCNNFGMKIDQAATDAVVGAALDTGITLFDTSDSYGSRPGESEELLGHALRGRRDEAIVATKFGSNLRGSGGPDWGARGSRRYIRKAVDASLKRLGTDWIDLYQIHWPDPETPMRETLTALDELVKEGKVRYIGCSNHTAWQMADAAWIARTEGLTPFVSAQNLYNLLQRDAHNVESEILPMCGKFGLGLLPYFPLASGVLTGKYQRDAPPPPGSRFTVWPVNRLAGTNWDLVEALAEYAAERGRPMIDIAIGSLTSLPAVGSVIAGATSPEQVRANAQAGTWRPTEEDRAALDEILQKY